MVVMGNEGEGERRGWKWEVDLTWGLDAETSILWGEQSEMLYRNLRGGGKNPGSTNK